MKKKLLTLGALLAVLAGCASSADSMWSEAGRALGVNFLFGSGDPSPMPKDDGPRFFDPN